MTIKQSISVAIFASAILGFASGASASVIDTTGGSGGSISPFGSPNTATYGQTFTVGSDHFLNSFSLFLNGRQGGSTLDLRGYIASWDGSKASSILYTSTTQIMGVSGAGQEFAFNTGALDLQIGSKYVAFLSVSQLAAQAGSTFTMQGTGNNYAGGDFVYYNNSTNFSSLTTNNWDCQECGFGDVMFKAAFSPEGNGQVPEPGSIALIGLGLMGLVAARRKAKASISA